MRSSRKNTLQIKTRCKLTDYSIKLPQFRFLIAILVECLSAVGAKADGLWHYLILTCITANQFGSSSKQMRYFPSLKKDSIKRLVNFIFLNFYCP